MPADAFIQTHERTPLEYPLKPLQEQIAHVHERDRERRLFVGRWFRAFAIDAEGALIS
jgi:hypothetical protein